MGSNNANSSKQIDLGLSLKSSYVPKTIAGIFTNLEKIDSLGLRLDYLTNYLENYREEISRVDIMKRQIPESMLFLLKAIEVMKENILRTRTNPNGDNLLDRLHVEEFFTRNRNTFEYELKNIISSSSSSSSSSGSDPLVNQQYNGKRKEIEVHHEEEPDYYYSLEYHRNISVNDNNNNNNNNIELDYRRNKSLRTAHDQPSHQTGHNNELADPIIMNNADPNWRVNTRRTWTTQLHNLFLLALDKLGGPEVASPKQIRDCMQVEGLTTDQIKSHLQKYRIQTRNSAAAIDGRQQQEAINGPDLPDQHAPAPAAGPPYHAVFLMFADDHHNEEEQRYQIPNLNTTEIDWDDSNAYIPQPPDHQATAAGNDDVEAEGIAGDGNFAAWLGQLRGRGF